MQSPGHLRITIPLSASLLFGCSTTSPRPSDEPATSGTTVGKGELPGATTSETDASPDSSSGMVAEDTSTSSGGETTDTTTGSGATGSGSSDTGESACPKNVVVMGYWPPTNEMLRPWSTNATQNPDGWIGKNWEGTGYDVYAYFPEFPPDGDPTNDEIGDPGSVGSPDFDLQVDYQATSADFWRIVDEKAPVIVITSSRGGDIGWEIEAAEGGHGDRQSPSPEFDWRSDDHGAQILPTQASVDPRSWTAISTYRQGNRLDSQLPLQAIATATTALEVTTVAIDPQTSGNYLSGFLGLHGLYYNHEHEHNVAAGHIHVGGAVPTADARRLFEATLRAVLQEHPADQVSCSPVISP